MMQNSVGASLLVASLVLFMPQLSDVDQEVLLAEIITKLKETQSETEKGKISIDAAKKEAQLTEQKTKLDEAEKKQREAEEKQKNASIWDKIKLAFQFLGAIFGMILGAVLMAVPGAQALGALLFVGGVLGLIGAIDSTVKMATGGYGIAAMCMPNASDEDRAKADMIFGITVAAVGAVVAIATIVVGFTAAAGTIATALAKITDAATKLEKAINVTQAILAIVVATGDVTAAAIRYTAAKEIASATEDRADAKRLDADIQMLDDLIDQAIQRMIAAGDRFNQMLDALTEAMQDRGNSLSKAKFTA